jgi:hypothetical protein
MGDGPDPIREGELQPIGEILPTVLRDLAAGNDDPGAATRLRLLAARFESSTDEEALAA